MNRDAFSTRWGFILAGVGSAVGMGNIWRFPIMVSKYGGLTYIIPYILCVILVASSGMIEEFALGRAAKAGPVGAFGYCTELRSGNRKTGEALGTIPVLGSLGLAIGYSVVMGWIIKYTWLAFSGGLFKLGTDMDAIGGTFGMTASAYGANLWIVIAVLIACIIMCFGISNGIEKANKIMMPILFGLFLILAFYIATLDGSGNGYKYILSFNPQGLLDVNVWIYAFGQAFFSLSVAGNGSVIYGSYLPDSEELPGAARNVAIFDTLAALLAAFVIIPAMAAGGVSCDSSGPGLMFIYLVNVLNGMDGGRIIGVVFFVCVLFAGVSSIINLYEVSVAFLQEKLNVKRVPATIIMCVIGCAIAINIQAITSGWMDVVSIYICPLGALLAGIMFFWVAGKDFAEKQVSIGSDKPIGKYFFPLGKYVYCIAALVALILGAVLGGIG